jgi:hypothetical protein
MMKKVDVRESKRIYVTNNSKADDSRENNTHSEMGDFWFYNNNARLENTR